MLFGGVALILGQLWGLSFGALAAFVGVMQSTYGPMRDLTRGWTKLQEAVPSAERFFEILDQPVETPDVVPPNRGSSSRSLGRVLMLWAVLVLTVYAVHQVLQAPGGSDASRPRETRSRRR